MPCQRFQTCKTWKWNQAIPKNKSVFLPDIPSGIKVSPKYSSSFGFIWFHLASQRLCL